MADKPTYRFKFSIVDETTGDVVASDFCQITDIREGGGCESVDMHVASTLRWFERAGRAEYEAANYAPDEEEQRQQQIGRDKARRTLAEISKSELLR